MRLDRLELDGSLYELTPRGTPAFPIEMYDNMISDFALHYVPWHWHTEVELVLVLRGATTLEYGGTVERLDEGDGAFINSGCLHAMHPQDGAPCETLNVVFSPEIVAGAPYSVFAGRYVQPLLQSGVGALRLSRGADADVLCELRAAYRDYQTRAEGYEIVTRNYLSVIWLALCRRCAAAGPDSPAENGRVKELLTFIAAHYAEPLTLETIAASAGVSPRTCGRCFQQVTGMTPFQYLLEYRVKTAAQLLLTTDQTVTEIGFAVGFNDASYFTKVFRTLTGTSPSAFRRRAAGREFGERDCKNGRKGYNED